MTCRTAAGRHIPHNHSVSAVQQQLSILRRAFSRAPACCSSLVSMMSVSRWKRKRCCRIFLLQLFLLLLALCAARPADGVSGRDYERQKQQHTTEQRERTVLHGKKGDGSSPHIHDVEKLTVQQQEQPRAERTPRIHSDSLERYYEATSPSGGAILSDERASSPFSHLSVGSDRAVHKAAVASARGQQIEDIDDVEAPTLTGAPRQSHALHPVSPHRHGAGGGGFGVKSRTDTFIGGRSLLQRSNQRSSSVLQTTVEMQQPSASPARPAHSPSAPREDVIEITARKEGEGGKAMVTLSHANAANARKHSYVTPLAGAAAADDGRPAEEIASGGASAAAGTAAVSRELPADTGADEHSSPFAVLPPFPPGRHRRKKHQASSRMQGKSKAASLMEEAHAARSNGDTKLNTESANDAATPASVSTENLVEPTTAMTAPFRRAKGSASSDAALLEAGSSGHFHPSASRGPLRKRVHSPAAASTHASASSATEEDAASPPVLPDSPPLLLSLNAQDVPFSTPPAEVSALAGGNTLLAGAAEIVPLAAPTAVPAGIAAQQAAALPDPNAVEILPFAASAAVPAATAEQQPAALPNPQTASATAPLPPYPAGLPTVTSSLPVDPPQGSTATPVASPAAAGGLVLAVPPPAPAPMPPEPFPFPPDPAAAAVNNIPTPYAVFAPPAGPPAAVAAGPFVPSAGPGVAVAAAPAVPAALPAPVGPVAPAGGVQSAVGPLVVTAPAARAAVAAPAAPAARAAVSTPALEAAAPAPAAAAAATPASAKSPAAAPVESNAAAPGEPQETVPSDAAAARGGARASARKAPAAEGSGGEAAEAEAVVPRRRARAAAANAAEAEEAEAEAAEAEAGKAGRTVSRAKAHVEAEPEPPPLTAAAAAAKYTEACFDACACWPVWSLGILLMILNLTSSFVAFYNTANLFSRGLLSSQFYKGGGYWLLGVAALGLVTGGLIGGLVPPACWAGALYLGGFFVSLFLSFVLIGRRGALLGSFGGIGSGAVIGHHTHTGPLGVVMGMVLGLLFGIVIGFAPVCRDLKINERYVRSSLGADRKVRRGRYTEEFINRNEKKATRSPTLRARYSGSPRESPTSRHSNDYVLPPLDNDSVGGADTTTSGSAAGNAGGNNNNNNNNNTNNTNNNQHDR